MVEPTGGLIVVCFAGGITITATVAADPLVQRDILRFQLKILRESTDTFGASAQETVMSSLSQLLDTSESNVKIPEVLASVVGGQYIVWYCFSGRPFQPKHLLAH